MTAVTALMRSGSTTQIDQSGTRTSLERRAAVPPLSPRLQLIRAVLVLVLAMSITMLVQLLVVSGREQASAQRRLFDRFRGELAHGTAPAGAIDADGKVLAIGAPVAYLEIPSLHLRQVVAEGTAPGTLFDGPGHRRNTVLPGQVGTSVVFGRRAAYGGPFADLATLRKGDAITVTTGQGEFVYKVIGVLHAGDPASPVPAAGSSRLVLATAAGSALVPNGLVQVDADIEGTAVGGPVPMMTAVTLPAEERAMATDTRTLWALALWLQALIVFSVGAVWAWHRWGRAQAWIVFLPPLLLVGLAVSREAARLLPNLM